MAPGVLVQPGMAILKVAQIDRVRLQANVGEKDLASIRVGSPVQVTMSATGQAPLTVTVTSVFPFVDQGPRTAVVEAAFHRLLFFADSPDTPWPDNAAEYTAFSARYRTAAGLDLAAAPLAADRTRWTHPTNYGPCQDLADAARAAGVEEVRYESARAPGPPSGVNIALLTCRAFGSREPVERQTWRIHLGPGVIRAICTFPEAGFEVPHEAFARDPRIARYSLRK